MKNTDVISTKLQDALDFLYQQDAKLKPVLDLLTNILQERLSKDELSTKDAFDMLISIQEQYTNNILLITKVKEIIDFKY